MTMKLYVTRKGALLETDCSACGATILLHQHTQEEVGACPDCSTPVERDALCRRSGEWYAGRYAMPGYLDCTPWEYDTNRRRLLRSLREHYGD